MVRERCVSWTQDGLSTEPSSTVPEASPVNERPRGKTNPYQADDAAQVEADLRRQFEVKNEVARKNGEPEPYPDLDTAVREAGERYREVVARGYPFGFESLEHFATFKSSLRTLLDEFGIPHDELAVHGSAVHKANPNDLDIAVMAGEDKWASTAEALRARTKHPKVRKSLEREIGKGKVGSFLFPRLDEGGSLMERLMQLEGLPSTQVSLVLRGGKYDIGPYLDF